MELFSKQVWSKILEWTVELANKEKSIGFYGRLKNIVKLETLMASKIGFWKNFEQNFLFNFMQILSNLGVDSRNGQKRKKQAYENNILRGV